MLQLIVSGEESGKSTVIWDAWHLGKESIQWGWKEDYKSPIMGDGGFF